MGRSSEARLGVGVAVLIISLFVCSFMVSAGIFEDVLSEKVKDRAYVEELRSADVLEEGDGWWIFNSRYFSFYASERRIVIEDKDNVLINFTMLTPYINHVGAGNDTLIVEYQLHNFHKDAKDWVKGIRSFDILNGYTEEVRVFATKYAVDYEVEECFEIEENISFCENITETEWIEFKDLKELPSDIEQRVGLFTNTIFGENIEYVPEFFGFEVLQYAEYDVTILDSFSSLSNPYSTDNIYEIRINEDATRAYVTSGDDDTFTIFNITNKSDIQGLASYTSSSGSGSIDFPSSLFYNSDIVFLRSTYDYYFNVFNVSDDSIVLLYTDFNDTLYENPSERNSFLRGDLFFYINHYHEDLVCLNVSNYSDVQFVDKITTIVGGNMPIIVPSSDNNTIFISSSGGNSVYSYNITDPFNMVLLDEYSDVDGNGSVDDSKAFDIKGDIMYVTSDDDKLLTLLNISDPSNIVSLGSYSNSISNSYIIEIHDNYLFAFTPSSMEIWDISDGFLNMVNFSIYTRDFQVSKESDEIYYIYYSSDADTLSIIMFNSTAVESSCTESLVNSSWSSWSDTESCQTNDYLTQSRTLVEYDENVCGTFSNVTYTEYQEVSCDYCTPSAVNSSWSSWVDTESCQIDDFLTQNKSLVQYDSNGCYAVTGLAADEFANTTFWDYQETGCDYCTPSRANESWSDWIYIEDCDIDDLREENRSLIEYDSNGCYALTGLAADVSDNVTFWEDDSDACNYCFYNAVNTSWSSWVNDGSCLISDDQTQNKSLIQYDSNASTCYGVTGIASDELVNVTFWDWQNVSCDYCTPSEVDDTWSSWADLEACQTNDFKSQERTQTPYDGNDCYAVTGLVSDNVSYDEEFDYQEDSCNFCSYSIVNSSWSNYTDGECNESNVSVEFRELISYDQDYDSCYAVTGIPADFWSNVTYTEYGNDSACIFEFVEEDVIEGGGAVSIDDVESDYGFVELSTRNVLIGFGSLILLFVVMDKKKRGKK